ncbi:MAG: hypothetical protein Q7R97_00150 [Candidatus Daviesbacteria bacterium]|nr:hypothetical protein [Candidatus Daviesbacteria bacterium]
MSTSKKIVTNLRIDANDWLQIKAIAAEQGISFNEYINLIAQEAMSKAFLDKPKKNQIGKNRRNIYETLMSLSKKNYKNKPMGLSEDDQIIYGL